jgi:hypothetical protein
MDGFKRFGSAKRFCRAYEEGRNFFRMRSRRNERVVLA